MMPTADQHRWFPHHPHHHPGIPPVPHPSETAVVSAGPGSFGSSVGPGTHPSAINPYMEPSYIEDMDAYLHRFDGQSAAEYYGINMQYKVHQRSLTAGKWKYSMKNHASELFLMTKAGLVGKI